MGWLRRQVAWGSVLAPTDIGNPLRPGEALYVRARVRPAWYWLWRRMGLFVRIVWRYPGPPEHCRRIDWRSAWAASKVAVGLIWPRGARRE